jgi:hypothetical protein
MMSTLICRLQLDLVLQDDDRQADREANIKTAPQAWHVFADSILFLPSMTSTLIWPTIKLTSTQHRRHGMYWQRVNLDPALNDENI